MLPDISDGTRVILSPVGAYNVTQWLQFIDYRPNIVMVSTESQVEIIRNAEDLSDITRREVLPDRLKLKDHMIPLYTHAGERNSAMEDTVPLESIRKQLFS